MRRASATASASTGSVAPSSAIPATIARTGCIPLMVPPPLESGLEERVHHPLHSLDLVLVHRVPHPRIELDVHLGSERAQHLAGLLHPLLGDVEVHVAAPEEDRRPVE